jgi:hypothetical protein
VQKKRTLVGHLPLVSGRPKSDHLTHGEPGT